MTKQQMCLRDFFLKGKKGMIKDACSDVIDLHVAVKGDELVDAFSSKEKHEFLDSMPPMKHSTDVSASCYLDDNVPESSSSNHGEGSTLAKPSGVTAFPFQTKHVGKYGALTTRSSKRPRSGAQTCLDFGQSDIGGVTTCRICGMIYNAVMPEDIRLHRRFCRPQALSNKRCKELDAADGHCVWLASRDVIVQLDRLAGSQRQNLAMQRRYRAGAAPVCLKVQESTADEFICYVLECGARGLARSTVVSRFVEALQFDDVTLQGESDYCLVAVVQVYLERLVCVVAGRPVARTHEPTLLPYKKHCETALGGKQYLETSQKTLCDVPYIWLQSELVLATTWRGCLQQQIAPAVKSQRDVTRDFFKCRGMASEKKFEDLQQTRSLGDAALSRALSTLGRHVTYGCALCPRRQFSYDSSVVNESMLHRVAGVMGCDDVSTLYTHTGASSHFQ
ncbi:hypothetical protein, conserved [Trypanosoma brucei gambiense DAL972]|uniref:N-acetyltransferase ESCO zinc-finger domain-containing protein n=1 Tax=Trypanosoma brucei gambiense (strain MHOM/CI/86/DAL972) TaxID=679716 RepID=D0A224_TRYB9|nr:hypothetical protein, conserved [Trypanosoma brucei gambiense DAL972]CBH15317.1 hypothetical protein, conserved [Trypanosoma brucei gambiense DAL972]|eukprot:XP_011777582.1 hypothetical protein, conserved [Trypanosoma brucei gambiense DAL972]